MVLEREDMRMSNNCEGCCHDGQCGYFSELNTYDISIFEEEQKAFEEFCCGCSCGDGAECNRDIGCDNYETEPIMG